MRDEEQKFRTLASAILSGDSPLSLEETLRKVRRARKEIDKIGNMDRPGVIEAYGELVTVVHRSLFGSLRKTLSSPVRPTLGGESNIYTCITESASENTFFKVVGQNVPDNEDRIVDALLSGTIAMYPFGDGRLLMFGIML